MFFCTFRMNAITCNITTTKGGKEIPGLTFEQRSYTLGEDLMPAGFDENIEGMTVGDTRTFTFDELMEPVFVSLREYLADGLERPFLVRGDDRVYSD